MLGLKLEIVLLIAELWFCTSNVECDANFTECYNTTTEMHCFSKIINRPLNFTEAQKLCSAIDATLPVIKNEEVQKLLETFISYLSKSGGIEDSISFFWTNANRIMETKWQWLNSSVISELNASVNTGYSFDIHVASLAGQNSDQQEVRLIANNPGEVMSYICECFGSDCQSQSGNVLRYGDKCYVASKENATWYDARNRCLKERGDLASFGDLKNTNIDFIQWLDLSNGKQYWVGARILWWLWKNSGNAEVRYTNWLRGYPVPFYSSDECVIVHGNSGIPSQINGWKTADCNQAQAVGAICYKVTSLETATMISTTQSTSVQQVMPISSRTPDGKLSSESALGIGLGVGLGVPLVIFIILTVFFVVKRKRSETIPQQKTPADNNELGTVREPSVEQVNESDVDHYQHLSRSLDKSSGTTYDKLSVNPEQSYEEFPSSVT